MYRPHLLSNFGIDYSGWGLYAECIIPQRKPKSCFIKRMFAIVINNGNDHYHTYWLMSQHLTLFSLIVKVSSHTSYLDNKELIKIIYLVPQMLWMAVKTIRWRGGNMEEDQDDDGDADLFYQSKRTELSKEDWEDIFGQLESEWFHEF